MVIIGPSWLHPGRQDDQPRSQTLVVGGIVGRSGTWLEGTVLPMALTIQLSHKAADGRRTKRSRCCPNTRDSGNIETADVIMTLYHVSSTIGQGRRKANWAGGESHRPRRATQRARPQQTRK